MRSYATLSIYKVVLVFGVSVFVIVLKLGSDTNAQIHSDIVASAFNKHNFVDFGC